MFCERCGAENSSTASFCRKCGAEIGDEVETRVAVRGAHPVVQKTPDAEGPDKNEQHIFAIGPTLLFVKIGYVLAAVAALFLVGVISAYQIFPAWLAIIFGLLLFLIPVYYHLRQRLVRYTLTHAKLEIDEGFISRRTRSVPLGRIQDVTVSASVIQRLLGFGDLSIDNASEDGGKLVLKNINSPRHHADLVLKQMSGLSKSDRMTE